MRCSHSNKLGDEVMNQGVVGGIRLTNLQERRSMSEMSVEELLEVDHEECKSILGSVDNRLVVLRCLDSLLDERKEKFGHVFRGWGQRASSKVVL